MKKIVTFIFASAFVMLNCGLATAQTPKITAKWETAPNENLQKNMHDFHFLDEDETSFYLLIQNKHPKKMWNTLPGKIFVEKYDKKTLKPVERKEIICEVNPKPVFYRSIGEVYHIGGKAYIHIVGLSAIYRDGDKTSSFARFDKKKMDIELLSFSNVDFKELKSVVATPDSSAYLFSFYKKDWNDKKNVNKPVCKLLLVDKDFNKIAQQDVTPNLVSHIDFAIDNDWNIYISGREYTDKNNYNYAILKYSGKNLEKPAGKMQLKDMLYQQCRIFTDKNNVTFAVGFCTDKTDINKTGSFYFSLKNDLEQKENFKFTAIPLNFLMYNHRLKGEPELIEKNKDDLRYAGYDIYDVLYADNGDVILCAEEYRGEWIAAGASNGRYYAAFHDIYVFRVNTSDGLKWVKRVPKFQFDQLYGNDYLGNVAFLSGDDVVLLFNDNKDNVKLNENSVAAEAYGTTFANISVVLDKNGNQKRQIVNLGVSPKFNPNFIFHVRISNETIFVTQSKISMFPTKSSEYKLGIISVGK